MMAPSSSRAAAHRAPVRAVVVPRRLVALVLVAVLAVTSVGCGAEPDHTGPARLSAQLVEDGFELALANTSAEIGEDHDLQIRLETRVDDTWVPDGDWDWITSASTGDASTVAVTDVAPWNRYQFRFRSHPADATPGPWSEPVSRLYVKTALPVIRVDTADGEPITGNKRPSREAIVSLDAGDDGNGSFTADAQVRGRGNTTWVNVPDKKSYQVDFDEPQGPLGLPDGEQFILLANFFDRSQLRTYAGMELSRLTGLDWTPQQRWVEVIFNGDYAGVYQLTEKVDVDQSKIDIGEPGPEVTSGDDLTGGYLLEIKKTNRDDKHAWETDHHVPISIYRPKMNDTNRFQVDYIRGRVDAFEDALFAPDYTDPTTGYAAHLDVDAFIDYWIVQELTANLDAFISSTYLYKRRNDPKLYLGPVWDLDVSMGSPYGHLASTPIGWHTIHPDNAANDNYRPWVMRLFSDPAFVRRVDLRWQQLLPGFRRVPGQILDIAPLAPARASDLIRWQDQVETRFGHRYGDTLVQDEPELLAAWLSERIDWMTLDLARLAHGGEVTERIPERPTHGPTPEDLS